jgi:hypothetical protein
MTLATSSSTSPEILRLRRVPDHRHAGSDARAAQTAAGDLLGLGELVLAEQVGDQEI